MALADEQHRALGTERGAGTRRGSIADRHRTLRELVGEEILERILTGELAPGTRLLEHELARELGVSRNPVRESFADLAATGLVEVVPRRGAYVAEVDCDDLLELLEVRSVLEAHASALAAQRHTAEDLALLDDCIERGLDAARRNDLLGEVSCHHGFLDAIDDAAKNRHLVATLAPLRRRTDLVYALVSGHRSVHSWDEHRQMREAIVGGDPDVARACATAHLAAVADALVTTAGSEPASDILGGVADARPRGDDRRSPARRADS